MISTGCVLGSYWATVPFTSNICRYAPDGKRMQTIVLPTDIPTCCEFGGKNLDMLYVTTAVNKPPRSKLRGINSKS